MRESCELEPYASSEGEPDFYNGLDQSGDASHSRITMANPQADNEHHVLEADGELHLSDPMAALQPVNRPARKRRKTVSTNEKDEPHPSRQSRVKRRRGLFTSSISTPQRSNSHVDKTSLASPARASTDRETRKSRASQRVSQPSPTLPDADPDTSRDPSAKPKPDILPENITTKVSLVVIASSQRQQELAPITVKLSSYTSIHAGFNKFFEFLTQECELGDLSNNVTAVSATYPWGDRKHRLRRDKIDTDGKTFCAHIQGAFEEDSALADKGCEIGLLLHVAM